MSHFSHMKLTVKRSHPFLLGFSAILGFTLESTKPFFLIVLF